MIIPALLVLIAASHAGAQSCVSTDAGMHCTDFLEPQQWVHLWNVEGANCAGPAGYKFEAGVWYKADVPPTPCTMNDSSSQAQYEADRAAMSHRSAADASGAGAPASAGGTSASVSASAGSAGTGTGSAGTSASAGTGSTADDGPAEIPGKNASKGADNGAAAAPPAPAADAGSSAANLDGGLSAGGALNLAGIIALALVATVLAGVYQVGAQRDTDNGGDGSGGTGGDS